MTTETQVQALPAPEAMLETIAASLISMRQMQSAPLPEIGRTVLIGDCYQKQSLRLVSIDKIDRRGVITVSDGTRFSTVYRDIISTRKIDDRYWSMYDLEDSYRRALKRNEQLKEAELKHRHLELIRQVQRLRSVEDASAIDQLLQLLEGQP